MTHSTCPNIIKDSLNYRDGQCYYYYMMKHVRLVLKDSKLYKLKCFKRP